jgi:hypothetical protein
VLDVFPYDPARRFVTKRRALPLRPIEPVDELRADVTAAAET